MSHVTLAGDLDGEYVIEERLPDGRLVLRPDTSAEAIIARTGGGRRLSSDEFAERFGELPEDGEG